MDKKHKKNLYKVISKGAYSTKVKNAAVFHMKLVKEKYENKPINYSHLKGKIKLI